MLLRRWSRPVLLKVLLSGIVVVSAGVAVVSLTRHPVQRATFNRLTPTETGTETVVIFLVSSSCGASRDDRLKVSMIRDRERLLRDADRRGVHVRFVGVATDGSFDSGIRLLNQFGEFDELVLGSGWVNEAMVRYVWRDLPGTPSLPQLLILTRSVQVRDATIDVGLDSIAVRLVGGDRIRAWLQNSISHF